MVEQIVDMIEDGGKKPSIIDVNDKLKELAVVKKYELAALENFLSDVEFGTRICEKLVK